MSSSLVEEGLAMSTSPGDHPMDLDNNSVACQVEGDEGELRGDDKEINDSDLWQDVGSSRSKIKTRKDEIYCSLCHCLKSQAWPRVGYPDESRCWFFDVKKMLEAIVAGCSACALLKDGIEYFQPLVGLDKIGDKSRSYFVCFRQTDSGWIVKDQRSRLVFEFVDLIESSSIFNCIPQASSASSLAWVRRKLQDCRSNHVRCEANTSSSGSEPLRVDSYGEKQTLPPLPTRLLDLGQSESDIRLLKTSPDARGDYACLSHCWGTDQPIQTTTKNISSFQTCHIPWDTLPRTFQDAIVFTRSLNLQYLWIDSLCIVQDDKNDWNKEAANMSSIYRNSTITLSATGSAHCRGGLFFERRTRKAHVIYASENHKIIVRPRIGHWSDIITPDFDEADLREEYPLLSRAWAYQERALAPRVLHFCKTELVWECHDQFSCQCGNYSPMIYYHPKEAFTNATGNKKEQQNIDPGAIHGAKLGPWHRIVHQYSKCNLTFEKDRLPALAGLAEMVQATRKGRYLAGLWEDSLIADLAWESFSETDVESKNMRSSSPTWSWSAVQGATWFPRDVMHPNASLKQLCQIIDVDYLPLNASNPRGEAEHGKLVIRGHVITTTFEGKNLDIPGLLEVDCKLDYDVSLPGPGRVEEGSKLFCLTLSSSSNQICSLVLRSTDAKMNIFERVGLVRCSRWIGPTLLQLFPAWRSSKDRVEANWKDIYCVQIYTSGMSKHHDFFFHFIHPADVVQVSDSQTYPCYLARLTPEEAATAKSHPSVYRICKKEAVPLDEPGEGEWYLPPDEAEKKARGEEYKEFYLGKIVKIV